jgi:hypothetical protein
MSQIETPPVRRWRWWRILLVSLLLIAVTLVGMYLLSRYRAVSRLQATLAQLDADDPNWRLADLENSRTVVPDDENSARVVVATRRLLPRNWNTQQLYDAIEDLPPESQLSALQYALLRKELDEVAPAVALAREIAKMPHGRHKLEIQPNPIVTLLSDQQETRSVASLLQLDSMRLAEAGKLPEAMISCRACFNAARSIGDEQFLISQLIRTACVQVACRSTERVLAQGEPPREELEALQKLALLEDDFNDLRIGMRGERASLQQVFEMTAQGKISGAELLDTREDGWGGRLFGWVARDRARAEQPLMLKLMTKRVEIAKLPLHEQPEAEKSADAEVRALPTRAVLTRLLLPAVQKVSQASRRKHAFVRCLVVSLALERYRQEKGSWPDKLEALTPKYLAGLPLDPYDGKPIRYRRVAEGVIVYSVGPDGKDDGGVLDRRNPIKPGTDLGLQLWDVAQRRQIPGPVPER